MKRKRIPAGNGIVLEVLDENEEVQQEIKINSLTVGQIHASIQSILDTIREGKTDADMLMGIAETLLPQCSNLTLEQFKALNNNVIDEVFLAFRECNAGFFAISSRLGLTQIAKKLYAQVKNALEEVVDNFRLQPEQSPQSIEKN